MADGTRNSLTPDTPIREDTKVAAARSRVAIVKAKSISRREGMGPQLRSTSSMCKVPCRRRINPVRFQVKCDTLRALREDDKEFIHPSFWVRNRLGLSIV